jgi:hypothetical protein
MIGIGTIVPGTDTLQQGMIPLVVAEAAQDRTRTQSAKAEAKRKRDESASMTGGKRLK